MPGICSATDFAGSRGSPQSDEHLLEALGRERRGAVTETAAVATTLPVAAAVLWKRFRGLVNTMEHRLVLRPEGFLEPDALQPYSRARQRHRGENIRMCMMPLSST